MMAGLRGRIIGPLSVIDGNDLRYGCDSIAKGPAAETISGSIRGRSLPELPPAGLCRGDDAEEREGGVTRVREVVLLVGRDVDEAAGPDLGLAFPASDLPPPRKDVYFVFPRVIVIRRASARRDLEMAHREIRRADILSHQDSDRDSNRALI